MSDLSEVLSGSKGCVPAAWAIIRADEARRSFDEANAKARLGPATGIGLGLVLSAIIWLAIAAVIL